MKMRDSVYKRGAAKHIALGCLTVVVVLVIIVVVAIKNIMGGFIDELTDEKPQGRFSLMQEDNRYQQTVTRWFRSNGVV